MTSPDADAEYVRELFASSFGARLRRLPESREHGQKTPDLELLDGDRRVAVVEVKTLLRVPRTEENGFRREHGGLVRDDNSPKRVGSWIHKAWKQLKHYSDTSKVLVFVNDEDGADVHDLEEAFNGFLDYGSEDKGMLRNVASRGIAEGRIREEKRQIDLYVWIDRHYGYGRHVLVLPTSVGPARNELRTLGPYFRCTTTRGEELMKSHFLALDCVANPFDAPEPLA